jgi:hypothetical protein
MPLNREEPGKIPFIKSKIFSGCDASIRVTQGEQMCEIAGKGITDRRNFVHYLRYPVLIETQCYRVISDFELYSKVFLQIPAMYRCPGMSI